MVRAGIVAIVVAVGITVAPVLAAGTCAAASGSTVVLRASDFDPDVLVWDTRQRAIDYAGGALHTATDVLVHTILARPGTRGLVVGCEAQSAHPRYSNVAEDTIGIKILNGPDHGRYGWVTSEDAHPLANVAASPSPAAPATSRATP